MAISLRISEEKEALIKELAQKTGKTETAFILEAIDEKLSLLRDRETRIRHFAGWLSHEEAQDLRNATAVFEKVTEGDWE
jgi:uncharacterized protein (DUF1778 family)